GKPCCSRSALSEGITSRSIVPSLTRRTSASRSGGITVAEIAPAPTPPAPCEPSARPARPASSRCAPRLLRRESERSQVVIGVIGGVATLTPGCLSEGAGAGEDVRASETNRQEEVMFRSNARVIAFAVCSALALTGSAQASGLATTTVTIKGQNGDYSGAVNSPRLHRCADQRTITVYKQKGSVQNPSVDTEIGSDTSELHGHHGEWSIGNSGFKSGWFYARAARTPGCKAASSKSIHR